MVYGKPGRTDNDQSDGGVSMKKKEVTRIYYYEKQIEKLERELEDIEQGRYKSPDPGEPLKGGDRSDPTGNTGVAAAELKIKIEKYRNEIYRKYKKIYEYIMLLDDPMIALIIIYRCIDLCTWEQVASRIGGKNTADSVRMAFNRHFKEQEK